MFFFMRRRCGCAWASHDVALLYVYLMLERGQADRCRCKDDQVCNLNRNYSYSYYNNNIGIGALYFVCTALNCTALHSSSAYSCPCPPPCLLLPPSFSLSTLPSLYIPPHLFTHLTTSHASPLPLPLIPTHPPASYPTNPARGKRCLGLPNPSPSHPIPGQIMPIPVCGENSPVISFEGIVSPWGQVRICSACLGKRLGMDSGLHVSVCLLVITRLICNLIRGA